VTPGAASFAQAEQKRLQFQYKSAMLVKLGSLTVWLSFANRQFNRKCHNKSKALIAGRTTVWFKNQLIGRPRYLHAIFRRAVQIDKPYRRQGDTIWFEITNNFDIDIQVQSLGQGGLGKLTLPANAITMVKTKVNSKTERAKLRCQITNFLIPPEKGLPVNLNVSLK